MSVTRVYFQSGWLRVPLRSLYPAIRTARMKGLIYHESLLTPEQLAAATCQWDQFALGKGVSHVGQRLSCFGISQEMVHGLHYRLAEDFPGLELDPLLQSYDDRRMAKGFGGFVRWVYFVDPVGTDDVIGLDFNLAPPITSGVVRSVVQAASVFRLLAWQGLPLTTRAVLINHHLCWANGVRMMQEANRLITLGDWLELTPQLFGPQAAHCPRCGQQTRTDKGYKYCRYCRAKFSCFLEERTECNVLAA